MIRVVSFDLFNTLVFCGDSYQVLKNALERVLEVLHYRGVINDPSVHDEHVKLYRSIRYHGYDEAVEVWHKYRLMEKVCSLGLPCPRHYLVNTWRDLIEAAYELGYPSRPVVVKPPISNGMRGLRIIDPRRDWRRAFYVEKPNGIYTRLEWLHDILGDSFDDLIVMEYLGGVEYTVDVLSYNGEVYAVIPRRRVSVKMGITFTGIVEKREDIIRQTTLLTKELKLNYAHGYQFKLDMNNTPKILECNPRIQGTMIASTLAGANIIYDTVKLALGEKIRRYSFNDIKWGLKIMRYWGWINATDM